MLNVSPVTGAELLYLPKTQWTAEGMKKHASDLDGLSSLEPREGFSVDLNQCLSFSRKLVGRKVGGVLWVTN